MKIHKESIWQWAIKKGRFGFLAKSEVGTEVKLAASKDRMKRAYNKRVNCKPFEVGNLVLRRTATTGMAHAEGKLTANWAGPYIIQEEIVPGL